MRRWSWRSPRELRGRLPADDAYGGLIDPAPSLGTSVCRRKQQQLHTGRSGLLLSQTSEPVKGSQVTPTTTKQPQGSRREPPHHSYRPTRLGGGRAGGRWSRLGTALVAEPVAGSETVSHGRRR